MRRLRPERLSGEVLESSSRAAKVPCPAGHAVAKARRARQLIAAGPFLLVCLRSFGVNGDFGRLALKFKRLESLEAPLDERQRERP